MSAENVKKSDKKFLENGTREEFRGTIYELLDLCGTIPPLKERIQLLKTFLGPIDRAQSPDRSEAGGARRSSGARGVPVPSV